MSAPIRPAERPVVEVGPLLLSGVGSDAGLESHRRRVGEVPIRDADALLGLVANAAISGRGGAGFPMARKLQTALASGRRRTVVVNGAEGEAASAKDAALLTHAPHRVLDGAVVAARALRSREVHVVTPSERPQVGLAVAVALAERDDKGIRWRQHEAAPRFVAGQARAVLELLAGREGLPVTAWAPEAVSGHRGRPTLLSNAETFAQLGAVAADPRAYAVLGTPEEPGTTLLTISSPPDGRGAIGSSRVVEVEHGSALGAVLSGEALAGEEPGQVLVGGFHGSWVDGSWLAAQRVSRSTLRASGVPLGAGVLVPLSREGCAVAVTARIVEHLAAESAGRCGPCRFGLPALADEVHGLADGADTRRRIGELVGLVDGRGACAHPDGTARLVRSLLVASAGSVESHLAGACACPRLAVAIA